MLNVSKVNGVQGSQPALQQLLLVAVDIRSTHNIGSMFRSCDGFGAELFLVGVCPRPIAKNDDRLPHIAQRAHKAIAKTSLGAEKNVPWQYAATFSECVSLLREHGFTIYAIEQSNTSKPLKQLHTQGRVAIVVGREVEGLTRDELLMCDGVFEIPMKGKKESYNVSVAAGIALYQAAGL